MKKKLIIALILFTFNAFSQKTKEIKISLTPEKWDFPTGKVEFTDYKSFKAMQINDKSGPVILKDLIFQNGTIEYDIIPNEKASPSIYFHMKSPAESELFYIRAVRVGNHNINDAIQYAPYIKGNLWWNFYDEYQGHAPLKSNEWNHVKMIVNGKQMKVFINGKEGLFVPQLEADVNEGKIAFEGTSHIANLVIQHNEVGTLSPEIGIDLTAHDAYYIRNWMHTDTVSLKRGNELSAFDLPKDEAFKYKISAERKGLINLSRKYGVERPKRNCIWLKVKINSEADQKKVMQLGFLDEVWVFVNKQTVYVDKQLYGQGMRKNPDGRISILNSSLTLNLKKGENEIMIGLSNFFYGWGIIARLENMEGLVLIE